MRSLGVLFLTITSASRRSGAGGGCGEGGLAILYQAHRHNHDTNSCRWPEAQGEPGLVKPSKATKCLQGYCFRLYNFDDDFLSLSLVPRSLVHS